MLILMWEFFKTGLFSVGGGLATIPFLQEMAQNYDWFTSEELLDMIAVSESTPGAIGINCASYAGYKAYGIPGTILASLALITPAIIIILIISKLISKFKENKTIGHMFEMLRPATAGLIFGAMFSVMVLTLFNVEAYKQTGNFIDIFKYVEIIIFAVFLFILRKYKKIHPIAIIACGAALGIIFNL
ncbi:chromate transporter [uncultured Helcococcus sp.]|uniref:chromate transporter n=1 Tax=uncultured Helcococcus sp. TaxID=1072508 RepID=UPI0028895F39|nr:chromate transporter [uncultured Helcococcus sp.]